MGYQEALILFNRRRTALRQIDALRKYKEKDELTFLTPYSILEANKTFGLAHGKGIKKGDVFLFVSGERFAQRSIKMTESELEIRRCRIYIQAE